MGNHRNNSTVLNITFRSFTDSHKILRILLDNPYCHRHPCFGWVLASFSSPFGYVYGYQVWLYIAFAFWTADRFARVARVAYYNGLGGSMAILQGIPNCDIMKVTLYPRVALGFGPGQHSFLYFSRLGRFWESHPFSVVGWNKPGYSQAADPAPESISNSTDKRQHVTEDMVIISPTDLDSQSAPATSPTKLIRLTQKQDRQPSIQFLIRTHSGLTSSLRHQLLSSPSISSIEMSIYSEV